LVGGRSEGEDDGTVDLLIDIMGFLRLVTHGDACVCTLNRKPVPIYQNCL